MHTETASNLIITGLYMLSFQKTLTRGLDIFFSIIFNPHEKIIITKFLLPAYLYISTTLVSVFN